LVRNIGKGDTVKERKAGKMGKILKSGKERKIKWERKVRLDKLLVYQGSKLSEQWEGRERW